MENGKIQYEKPFLTLHRTQVLLNFLSFSMARALSRADVPVTDEEVQKNIREQILQAVGFVETACQHMDYMGREVPDDIRGFAEIKKEMNEVGRTYEYAHMENAKDIIDRTLKLIAAV